MELGSALLLLALSSVDARDLGCSTPDSWAPTMAFVHLKNAGLTDNPAVDFNKTHVELLAQQKIGKDLYRQIHRVTFRLKASGMIEVITHSNASSEECSMSSVQVFVVSKQLGKSP
ncbi:hypothetical protein CSC74_12980 [Pseudoxanthomonas yeongjuensis]|uniref:hypothetical protein n=1 Tax=Pseudoxanthomonas yeongjuensis TaxID=377616 RepID=UPI001390BAF1|nr:hypothetical protein [Pseudoxanthomonas yeongjuensis]KAF1715484.1 hypothetical protein CSC74_12980 [Pseudoxanthomonas yeongjuensis]